MEVLRSNSLDLINTATTPVIPTLIDKLREALQNNPDDVALQDELIIEITELEGYEIINIWSELITTATPENIDEEKKLWCFIETALDEGLRTEIAQLVALEGDVKTVAKRCLWIADELLADALILELDECERITLENLLEAICNAEEKVDKDSQFLTSLFNSKKQNIIGWLNDDLFKKLPALSPKTVAVIFCYSTRFQIENVRDNLYEKDFVRKAAFEYFAIEASPRSRTQFLVSLLWMYPYFERMEFWKREIKEESPLVPYLHSCISPVRYLETIENQDYKKYFDQLVWQSWKGTQKEKRYLVERIQKNGEQTALLSHYTFCDGFDDSITLREFCVRNKDTLDENLEDIMGDIQKIPPFVIAVAMNDEWTIAEDPDVYYRDVLMRFMEQFTEDQKEACAMFLSEEGLNDYLDKYKTKIIPYEFAKILYSIPHDISDYILKNIDEEIIAVKAKLLEECAMWQQECESISNSHSTDEILIGLKNRGEAISRMILCFRNHFLAHYAAQFNNYNIKEEAREIKQHLREIQALQDRLKDPMTTLSEAFAKLNTSSPAEQNDPAWDLEEGYLLKFNPILVDLIGLNTPDKLATWGLNSQRFSLLGLSLKNLEDLETLKGLIDSLKGDNQSLESHWKDLSQGVTISEEPEGLKWEEKLSNALNTDGNLEKLPEVADFIRNHFKGIVNEDFSGTLEECIHFIRIRQFAHVVYNYVKNFEFSQEQSDAIEPRRKKAKVNS